MLAIAGIIGSAGVGGYTVAMKKHRANELIHEAAGRALAVSQQLAVGRKLDEIDFGGYPNNDTGHGKFSDKPIPLAGGEFFKIPITGMDQNTCEQLKVMAGGSLRRVDCKDDENGKVTADLIYQKDLSEMAGKIPEDTDGISDGNDSNNTTSPNCTQYSGTSTSNTGGIAGKASDGDDWCRCPSGKAYSETNGCIVACSGHGTLDENEDCVCQGGYCGVVCENQITCQHGTWTPDKCECDANWYGPLCDSTCDGWRAGRYFNYFGDGWLNCYSCSDLESHGNGSGMTSFEECSRCPNRQLYNTYTLYLDDTGDIWDDIKPEKIMGEKVMGACGLKDCGKNAYRVGNDGCHPCEGNQFVFDSTSKEECDKCTNRELVPYAGYEFCLPKCSEGSVRCDVFYCC